jgi:hypothetical protein
MQRVLMAVMGVYGSDTGAVMLIEEHKPRVCEETVLMYTFGFESKGVRGTAGDGIVGSCIGCIGDRMLLVD